MSTGWERAAIIAILSIIYRDIYAWCERGKALAIYIYGPINAYINPYCTHTRVSGVPTRVCAGGSFVLPLDL